MEQPNQPINLSSLLNLPGRYRGCSTIRGRGAPHGHGSSQSLIPSHGRRGPTKSDSPLGFSPKEIEASHRDKRQRLESTEGESRSQQNAPSLVWAPKLTHGNRLVSIRDSVDSEGIALALSQAFMLPRDMQREVESSPDNLFGSFMVHSAKPSEKLAEEEGGSLDKDLNANVSEQHSAEAEQIGVASNSGQKEACGGRHTCSSYPSASPRPDN
ncbi:hypothetical protein RHSIM_Rhsim13G0132900 [Rhododendron simsii]|uniref:Uncharacterized protein n=1 Tax=Rhododendron simsii TaxID=118357 RepID=A0A834L5B0_RHOSS|nr:hypothetical protein RHSIM_Rhsim13G0132900 [Rhododendron simsii]